MKKLWLILIPLLVGSATYTYWLFNQPKLESGGPIPITEIRWNGETKKLGNQAEGIFSGKQRNFKDENNNWKNIDDSFEKTATDFSIVNAPFEVSLPLRSTGTAILNDNHRWNVKGDRELAEQPLTMSIQAEGVNDVPGQIVNNGRLFLTGGWMENVNYVIYSNAYQNADLIYFLYHGQRPYLEKLIVYRNAIPQDAQHSFILTFNNDPDFYREVNGQRIKWLKQISLGVPKGKKLETQTNGRNISFMPIRIWDSSLSERLTSGKVLDLQTDIQPLGNGRYRLTKFIPAFFFVGAVLPVFTDEAWFLPDADPETNTVDGCILVEAGASWSAARDATVGTQASDIGANLTARVNTSVDIYRCPTTFNTTTIEDNATIGSSSFRGYVNSVAGTNSNNYAYTAIVRFGWSNDAIYANASTTLPDGATTGREIYDQIYSVAGSNVLPTNALMASTTDNVITNTGANTATYHNWTFNAEGQREITEHIVTCCAAFGTVVGYDMKNVSGGALTGLNIATADTAGTSSDPFIVVTWTLPAAAADIVPPNIPIIHFLLNLSKRAFAHER